MATARTVLATLDGSAPWQRLQVDLRSKADGGLALELREQHYAEGLGWYDQRSLALDARQVAQLRTLLGRAATALDPADRVEPRSILPFPGPRDVEPTRPAAGDAV